MFIEPLLQRLSVALNKLLAQDPDFLPAIAPLKGRCFCIQVQGLQLQFYLRIEEGVFVLTMNAPDREADVTVEGPPLSLLSLVTRADAIQAAQDSGIRMRGDLHIARRLNDTLAKMDIDWEGILAQHIGDMPAHQLGNVLRQLSSWRHRTIESWQGAVGEYLQEEARAVPTRVEADYFFDRVDTLRDAVERLEVRIMQLTRDIR